MQACGGHLQIQTCLNQNDKSESKDAWHFTGQIYLKSDWRKGFHSGWPSSTFPCLGKDTVVVSQQVCQCPSEISRAKQQQSRSSSHIYTGHLKRKSKSHIP
jgi:hypothetical protein